MSDGANLDCDLIINVGLLISMLNNYCPYAIRMLMINHNHFTSIEPWNLRNELNLLLRFQGHTLADHPHEWGAMLSVGDDCVRDSALECGFLTLYFIPNRVYGCYTCTLGVCTQVLTASTRFALTNDGRGGKRLTCCGTTR